VAEPRACARCSFLSLRSGGALLPSSSDVTSMRHTDSKTRVRGLSPAGNPCTPDSFYDALDRTAR